MNKQKIQNVSKTNVGVAVHGNPKIKSNVGVALLGDPKGITLIALVITIVVLIILAGVAINLAINNNGIFTKAKEAKTQTEKASLKEQIEFAVLAAKISNNFDTNLDKEILQTELAKITGASVTKSENDDLPWTVKKDGYIFTISQTGEVKEKVGIAITTGDIDLLKGETTSQTVTAELLNGETGTIKWSSTGNITLSQTTGTTTTVALSESANVGDIATITAEIEGKSQKDTIKVKVVTKATGLTIEPVTLVANETKDIGKITVEPANAEGIEIKGYTITTGESYISLDTTTGKVTGTALGSATITVTAEGKISKETITGTCSVTVQKSLVTVTAQQIAQNPKLYYGKEVKNYKASETDDNVYRIFYVNTIDNEFGDPQYTIYLKADDSMAKDSNSAKYNLNDYAKYDSTNTKVIAMNPKWAAQRGTATWKINEQAAAYLCSPVTSTDSTLPWSGYYNPDKANYVIGSPSVEMYVKSYNQAYNGIITDTTKYPLGAEYRATSSPGYIYTLNGKQSTISNTDYYTGTDSLDYSDRYNNMYCGKNGNKGNYIWWLASPSADYSNCVCNVRGDSAYLYRDNAGHTNGLCPLVSLKSNFQPQIEV